MEYSFVITTESNSEIPFAWEDETGVRVLRMPYTVNDTEYYYDLGRDTDIPAFYDLMRDGASVSTALRNQREVEEYFEPYLQAGKDILHIAFSSALSGTFNNEVLAAQELMQRYPGRRIELVDTLAISGPLAQLVFEATRMQKQGKTLDEIRDWVEENKQRSCALFTVDSLEYLRRGGRLSGAAAFFGTVLEIKPVLYVSPEGKLVPIEKVRGRKKAVKYILDKCKETIVNPQEQTITICQADCMEEALALEKAVREQIAPKDVRIHPVGPTIGSHCGPGTVSLIYYGKSRETLKP
ncbi:DegV family protein [Eubacteriales bacterium OttesenSCG-928-K08]|nr:DegV family protein [Eubacteriales bacterium OttesenSCG-928-K08]